MKTDTAAGDSAASPREQAQQVFLQALASYLSSRDHTNAEKGFARATEIDPNYPPAWFNLGVLSESDKNWSKAKRSFNEYIRVAPNGPDAGRAKRELQILAQYSGGKIDQAAVKQAEYDAMIQRARGFLSIGLFREAIAEAGRAQAADSSRWESYAVVSLCMAKQHKRDDAVKFKSLAVTHAPTEKRGQIQGTLTRQINIWNR